MAPLNEESVQEIAAEGQEVELTPEQKKEQLGKLMADGKRDLRAGNFETASQKFGEAAEFTEKHYGPLAAESFEPNFMYGRTLVELSVVENDLFTNAMVNMPKKNAVEAEEKEENDGNESMTEDEKDDVREAVADALAENAEELEKKETEGTEEESKEEKTDEKAKGDTADEETKEEKTEEESKEEKTDEKAKGDAADEETKEEKTEKESKEGKADEESKEESTGETAEGASKEEKAEETAENAKDEAMDEDEAADKEDIEDGDSEDEEEDLDNNELAWEALEVASKIADKMIEETGSVEWKKNKADVFVQLAQCTTNEEKYDLALEDLGRARTLMAEIATSKGDRLTAEIYFHEGRIQRLRSDFILAEEAFNTGASVMETFLEGLKTEAGETPTDDQKTEMEELVQVIKDFKERAEDCKGSAVSKETVAKDAEKEKAETPAILTSSNANSDPTANDISSLVRKKRVHESSEAEGAAKKAKSEEAVAGDDENIPAV